MTCLVDPAALEYALDVCQFRNVPGWIREVLVVWPHSEDLVQKLLDYGCIVTVVVNDTDEFKRMRAVQAWIQQFNQSTLHVVFGDPLRYIAAVSLQRFAAVFIPDSADTAVWQLASRRILTWNGRLNQFSDSGEPASYEKRMGWMIMGYPRCGTHMLATALDTHPDLTCYGEAFNPLSPAGSHRFETVKQVLEKSWVTPRTGFAVHSSIDRMGHHLNMADSMYGYKDFWKIIPDYTPTILVTRRNLLARYVSHLSAIQTGIWNSTDVTNRNNVYASVYVDINAFVADMKYVQDCWDNAAARLKYSHSVVYEDMVGDFNGTMRKVQNYLQVPYSTVAPETVKLSVSMEEVIENYVQVRAWCRRNGYERFIDEA